MLVVNVGQHRSFVVLDEIDVVSAAVTYDTAGDEGPRPLGQKDHFKQFSWKLTLVVNVGVRFAFSSKNLNPSYDREGLVIQVKRNANPHLQRSFLNDFFSITLFTK